MAETQQSPAAQQYPNLNPYNSSNGSMNKNLESAKNYAASTMDSVKNSQTVQNLSNGPVAEKARVEADATRSEFSNLAAARTTPSATTATGQNLTHYHSMFYSLLSWENPRATGISFAMTIAAIFVARYVPIVKYGLKALWVVLGITAAAEIAGKVVLGQGVASKMRPRKYYTIPRETLETMLEDVEHLVNFFVIEFQRIIFAENVWATTAAFFASLITYFLIKVTPAWGLALLGTAVLYLVPLVYVSNKELIDHHLSNANNMMNEQTQQFRDLAAHHTNNALETTKSAAGTYASKAQEMVGHAKRQAVDKGYVSHETANKVPGPALSTTETAEAKIDPSKDASFSASSNGPAADAGVSSDSFPSAPKADPVAETAEPVKEEASAPLTGDEKRVEDQLIG